MFNCEGIEQKIGYEFKDKSLLATAFTHSSFAYTHHIESNERLEFLGDSLLNFVTTDFLYNNYDYAEGYLSKIKAYLVSSDSLSASIDEMSVISSLKSENFNPHNSKNVMCDLFEAIVGAIYLDSNFENAKKFIFDKLNLTKERVNSILHEIVDYKTKLQEFVQQSGTNTIEYVLIKKSGLAHEPEFTIELKIQGKSIVTQSAKSKKLAESLCAKFAYEMLTKQK